MSPRRRTPGALPGASSPDATFLTSHLHPSSEPTLTTPLPRGNLRDGPSSDRRKRKSVAFFRRDAVEARIREQASDRAYIHTVTRKARARAAAGVHILPSEDGEGSATATVAATEENVVEVLGIGVNAKGKLTFWKKLL